MALWITRWPDVSAHPGAAFGLPASGVNATAGFGPRLVALALDWVLAELLTFGFLGLDALADPNVRWTVLAVWFLLTALATALFGRTPGMVALGIRVARTDMAQFVGVPRAVLRTVLIALVLPPLARDDDGRGWHDRATTTIVVRTR